VLARSKVTAYHIRRKGVSTPVGDIVTSPGVVAQSHRTGLLFHVIYREIYLSIPWSSCALLQARPWLQYEYETLPPMRPSQPLQCS
jgi:hypothetical protein